MTDGLSILIPLLTIIPEVVTVLFRYVYLSIHFLYIAWLSNKQINKTQGVILYFLFFTLFFLHHTILRPAFYISVIYLIFNNCNIPLYLIMDVPQFNQFLIYLTWHFKSYTEFSLILRSVSHCSIDLSVFWHQYYMFYLL